MTLLASNALTQTKTMKAARFYAPGDVRYEDTPCPLAGPGELVIQINTALTCGTDLKTYRRGHPVLIKTYPSPFGHEGAGTVVSVGDNVTRFHMGDRVVAANSAPCMACFFCQKDQYNLCEHLDLLNGTYAQYLKLPARIVEHNTHLLPDTVSFDAAAFCEPLAVSVRGIEACNIQPGDRVAVIGLGAIGLMMLKLAKLKGASTVALGRSSLKRTMAQDFAQADGVIDMTEPIDLQTVLSQYTPHGYGFDVVIEAVGQTHTWEMALNLVRRGGLVNLFGGCESGSTMALDTRRLHYDEITLVSPFHHTPRHVKEALEWINSGMIDPTPLITHERSLSQVPEALNLVASGTALKVAIRP